MDHVLVEMDDDFGGNVDLGRGPTNTSGMGIPIEASLRSLAIGILYEACRVQKFDSEGLRKYLWLARDSRSKICPGMFDDPFVERLFDLVELTRNVDDESLNYSVIKLIVSIITPIALSHPLQVALNEQFMVAAMPGQSVDSRPKKEKKHVPNRILEVLMRRIHSSKTFGENIIFMLNRASNTEEDLVMQLLLLKMLYLLFTTPGTQQYFYTNDLRVLVDVFLRELVDLPEESEALRHTYLRVLNPLLSNTQLRETPYKYLLVRRTLQSLISHGNIREITTTTRRLVERCLGAEWCRSLPEEPETNVPPLLTPGLSSIANPLTIANYATFHASSAVHLPAGGAASNEDILELPRPAFAYKTLHKSFSAEVLQPPAQLLSQMATEESKVTDSTNGKAGSANGKTSKPTTSDRSHNTTFDLMPEPPHYRKPPAVPEGTFKPRKKSFTSTGRKDSEDSMAIHHITLPPAGMSRASATSPKSPRRPSLGNAELPRMRNLPPPVPTLDRASLESKMPRAQASSPPLVHRRDPPAIPSKSKKPKSNGAISDSPLSKLAYSATTAAR